jgi:hypothetical protein
VKNVKKELNIGKKRDSNLIKYCVLFPKLFARVQHCWSNNHNHCNCDFILWSPISYLMLLPKSLHTYCNRWTDQMEYLGPNGVAQELVLIDQVPNLMKDWWPWTRLAYAMCTPKVSSTPDTQVSWHRQFSLTGPFRKTLRLQEILNRDS